MVSDERALALQLAGLDDARLAEVLTWRAVSAGVAWRDFFDAAEGLLEPASIDRALQHLPRRALADLTRLADGGDGTAPAVPADAQLLLPHGVPGAVAARVRRLRETQPTALTPPDDAPPPAATPPQEASAAERAFTATGALADLLLAAGSGSLALTTTGSVAAADRRRLQEAGIVADAAELDDLVAVAHAARLVDTGDREATVSAEGDRWLHRPTAERWERIAAGIVGALPAGLRDVHGGIVTAAQRPDAYPLDTDWPDAAETWTRILVRWGLSTAEGAEPIWTAGLRTGGSIDAGALREHLPAEIDRVYLQADLSVIAPGPLLPDLELRLRRIAARESRAQASTYRFTGDSLDAGLTDGETAESIREFLSALSLTGIPQPLEYLLDSTAQRHGAVRVRADASRAITVVEVDDPHRREALSVDQGLRPLGLVPEGELLLTRVTRDAVAWALADARYPVTVIDDDGNPTSPRRSRRATRAAADGPARYGELIARLRAGHSTDSDEAWLERELEQAVRARAAIRVSVRMPDGSDRDLILEASGLGGGRLRGLDRSADVERTLPLRSIVRVAPA
ncbi:helicase-associated domain-containing protein [Microbacterium sp. SSW1-59]|uniref:helicase-associated domain-containing protein n=1 Tax=Microbacterium xanthum TaxID=3079794 RepID=UPI002AD1FFCC|nr:helicase-associated domain-containing protein [Microbacterium sp. SSW1-59]MDZ8199949.1 helicase-associated domain-containing protein [Microbacterium sp. SSW1-59]